MKKRTALLIAIITAFTAMPASPVYADTAIPEEAVLLEGAEAELSNGEVEAELSNGEAEAELSNGVAVMAGEDFSDTSYAEEYSDEYIGGPAEETDECCVEYIDAVPKDVNCVDINSMMAQGAGSGEYSDTKVYNTTYNGYFSYKGNDPSRSFYINNMKEKPTQIKYNSSKGKARIFSYKIGGKKLYCLRFTFNKDEKRSVTVSYKHDGNTFKAKIVPHKTSYKKAAENIKVGKIRLSDLSKSFYFEERSSSGKIEIKPAKGWKIDKIYKKKLFENTSKASILTNGQSIKLKLYDQIDICLKNEKSGKYTWYIYRALYKGK